MNSGSQLSNFQPVMPGKKNDKEPRCNLLHSAKRSYHARLVSDVKFLSQVFRCRNSFLMAKQPLRFYHPCIILIPLTWQSIRHTVLVSLLPSFVRRPSAASDSLLCSKRPITPPSFPAWPTFYPLLLANAPANHELAQTNYIHRSLTKRSATSIGFG